MSQVSLRQSTLVLLSSLLALGTVACGNHNPIISTSEAANTLPKSKTAKASSTPQPSPSQAAAKPPNFYQQALDTATGATVIGEQAFVREDWALATSRWQEAIRLLKAVPASSPDHAAAQTKLKEYQGYLAVTQAKATPPPSKSCSSNTNPHFFFAPIQHRIGGIPVIEVTLNDQHQFKMMLDTGASKTLITESIATQLNLPIVGMDLATIADGSVVLLPVSQVKSKEIDGRVIRDLSVAIAPPELEMGLLGHDFLKGYDVIIKENVVEFRRQPGVKATTKLKLAKSCQVDTTPAFFSVPIKRRDHETPVIEVTFNTNQKFDMIFDTGATSTLITQEMAKQLDVPLMGTNKVKIADGSVVTLPVALVESQKINSRVKTDVVVSVAPPAQTIGLLGQDFFEGYDVTVKKNVIEFRRQRYSN